MHVVMFQPQCPVSSTDRPRMENDQSASYRFGVIATGSPFAITIHVSPAAMPNRGKLMARLNLRRRGVLDLVGELFMRISFR